MPDIPDKEKEEIRSMAAHFSKLMATLSFKNGSQIYYEVFSALYSRSARWRYCLICGKVDLPEEFTNKRHDCPPVSFHKVQTKVPTSWMKLRDFFIKEKYKKTLEKIGTQNSKKLSSNV